MKGNERKFETRPHFVSEAHGRIWNLWNMPESCISIQFSLQFMCVNIDAGLPLYCGNSCNIYRL